MKKITLSAITAMTLCSASIAQEGFFQTLESNGADAVYTEYYSLWDEDKDGTYQISGLRYKIKYETTSLETGEKIGLQGYNEESKKAGAQADAKIWDDSLIGYPHTYMIYDTKSDDALVLVGDYLFELENVNPKTLKYKSIDAVYIRKGSGKTEEVKEEVVADDKKSKLKGKLGSIKDKVKSALIDPDMSKLAAMNIDDLINNYLTTMRKKDEEYAKSAEETKQWKNVLQAAIDYEQEIKDYNEAYYRSPKYHKILQNTANGQVSQDRKNLIKATGDDSKVDNCKYIIKNESSETFTYVISTGAKGTIPPGGQQEFSCYYLTFFAEGEHKGKLIRGGGLATNGKTYIYK